MVPFPLPVPAVALVVLRAVGVVDHARGRTRQIVYAKTLRSGQDESANGTIASEGSGSVLWVGCARQAGARSLSPNRFHQSLRLFWM